VLKLYDTQKRRNYYAKSGTVAKYLPNLSVQASYNRDELINPSFAGQPVRSRGATNYYRYGFNISMPFDFNIFRDIESSKIDYLKAGLLIEDKKKELLSLYEQVTQNLKKISHKIVLAKENFEIYKKILDDTQKLYKAGYKTESDVRLLQNSKDMALIDIKVFKLDQQLELLNLYEYYIDGEELEI